MIVVVAPMSLALVSDGILVTHWVRSAVTRVGFGVEAVTSVESSLVSSGGYGELRRLGWVRLRTVGMWSYRGCGVLSRPRSDLGIRDDSNGGHGELQGLWDFVEVCVVAVRGRTWVSVSSFSCDRLWLESVFITMLTYKYPWMWKEVVELQVQMKAAHLRLFSGPNPP